MSQEGRRRDVFHESWSRSMVGASLCYSILESRGRGAWSMFRPPVSSWVIRRGRRAKESFTRTASFTRQGVSAYIYSRFYMPLVFLRFPVASRKYSLVYISVRRARAQIRALCTMRGVSSHQFPVLLEWQRNSRLVCAARLTTRPLAHTLVAEWLSEQHKSCTWPSG